MTDPRSNKELMQLSEQLSAQSSPGAWYVENCRYVYNRYPGGGRVALCNNNADATAIAETINLLPVLAARLADAGKVCADEADAALSFKTIAEREGAHVDALTAERDALQQQLEIVEAERDALMPHEMCKVRHERDLLQAENERLKAELRERTGQMGEASRAALKYAAKLTSLESVLSQVRAVADDLNKSAENELSAAACLERFHDAQTEVSHCKVRAARLKETARRILAALLPPPVGEEIK